MKFAMLSLVIGCSCYVWCKAVQICTRTADEHAKSKHNLNRAKVTIELLP